MPNFQLESVAYDQADSRQGVRVEITLAGPSGRYPLDIRIMVPTSEDFASSRTIEFVNGKAKLIMTPFSRLTEAREGVIHLRIAGQDLPYVRVGGSDGAR